jgi:hypothetical protein
MAMKKIIILAAFLISQIVLASESSDYLQSIQKSVTNLQNLKKDCAASSSQSNCITNYLNSNKVTNSTEITLLATVVVNASLQDKSHGMTENDANLKMIDNLLLMLEKINTKNFYLAGRPHNTEVELLKKDDEKVLATAKDKFVSLLSKAIDDSLKISATYAKGVSLQMRLNNFKSVKWAY